MITVKPLDWDDKPGLSRAQTNIIACYSVWDAGDHWECSLLDGQFPTINEAKAAAQADYETRILSAITNTFGPTRLTKKDVADLRQVLAAALQSVRDHGSSSWDDWMIEKADAALSQNQIWPQSASDEAPAAYMHPFGAIWRADNYPAGMDFSNDGWIPLYARPQSSDVRAEKAEEEVARLKSERLYIIGFNDGFEEAEEQAEATCEKLASALEDARQKTERSPLLVGFYHGNETMKEVLIRLFDVREVLDAALSEFRKEASE